MTMLSVNIEHHFRDFSLDVNFDVPEVGITAIFGESGCGKTSVLRSIAGLMKTQKTRIRFGQDDWQNDRSFKPAYRRPIGYVFQEASLFPHLNVQKNLEYGWQRTPTRKNAGSFDFSSIVELLGIHGLLQRTTDKLSGGERQRVAIARALLTSPELLLLDEPLSALDHGAKQQILPYLERLHDQFAIPSLYVSHDPKEVARLADHMILMKSGKVEAQGSAADLLTRLDLPLSGYDDATSIIEGDVSAHDRTFDLTWISTPGGRIAVPGNNLREGQKTRVEIHARDVSLAMTYHSDTSILNILPARIIDLRDASKSQVLVRLELIDRQIVLARITRKAAVSLDLQQGRQLYAQIKSAALLTSI